MMSLNVNDPADASRLMEAGMFWMGGPRTIQLGVDMLVDGTVKATRAIISNIPTDMLALIDRKRVEAGSVPLAETVRTTEDDGA